MHVHVCLITEHVLEVLHRKWCIKERKKKFFVAPCTSYCHLNCVSPITTQRVIPDLRISWVCTVLCTSSFYMLEWGCFKANTCMHTQLHMCMTVRACMFVFLCVALYGHCNIIQWYSPDHKQLSNQIFPNLKLANIRDLISNPERQHKAICISKKILLRIGIRESEHAGIFS